MSNAEMIVRDCNDTYFNTKHHGFLRILFSSTKKKYTMKVSSKAQAIVFVRLINFLSNDTSYC